MVVVVVMVTVMVMVIFINDVAIHVQNSHLNGVWWSRW